MNMQKMLKKITLYCRYNHKSKQKQFHGKEIIQEQATEFIAKVDVKQTTINYSSTTNYQKITLKFEFRRHKKINQKEKINVHEKTKPTAHRALKKRITNFIMETNGILRF